MRQTTRRFAPIATLIAVLLLAAGCAGPGEHAGAATDRPAIDPDADRDALIDAHLQLLAGMESANAETFVAVLDDSPDLLIFHPFLRDRFHGIGEVRDNLNVMFSHMPESSWTEVHPAITIDGNVGWLTYNVLVKSAALEQPFIGRGTEIWTRTDDGWRLIHGHWSENAELAGTS